MPNERPTKRNLERNAKRAARAVAEGQRWVLTIATWDEWAPGVNYPTEPGWTETLIGSARKLRAAVAANKAAARELTLFRVRARKSKRSGKR